MILREGNKNAGALTQTKGHSKDLTANAAKHELTSVVNSIHLGVVQLKATDNVARPGGNGANGDQQEGAGDDSKDVECSWNGENTQSDAKLHHDGDGSNPPNLHMLCSVSFCQFFTILRFERRIRLDVRFCSWDRPRSSRQIQHLELSSSRW